VKRILFISYHFPPSAAVGGQRLANFARGLTSIGWASYVVTIKDKYVKRLDPDRLRGLEKVTVNKVRVLPTALGVIEAALGLLRPRPPAAPVAAGKPASTPPANPPMLGTRPNATFRERMSRQVRRYILSFLELPDAQKGWILPAILGSIRQIRRHRIEWFLTSCPPYSVHLVGLAVKRATGARWIADFRDPWMTGESKQLFATSAWSLRVEAWLERRVVERSDLLLFNVERARDVYCKRYHHQPAEKFVYIPNGITAPPTDRTQVSKYDTFTLSYTGALYAGRSPEPIFQALSKLIREGKTTPDAIRVKLLGHCRDIEGVPTAVVARKYGLASSVEVSDAVPYAEAVDVIRRSHLALLFAPNLQFQIPAKIYDYLAAGTRILAIAGEGGTADLIRDTGSGRTFDAEEVEAIAEFIEAEMAGPSPPEAAASSLARFTVRHISEELAGHMQRADSRII